VKKNLEDKNVRDHEKKLIEDLQRQLQKKNDLLHKAEEKVVEVTGKPYENETSLDQLTSDTEEKLLHLRKEILTEIHEVDDKLANLSMRIQRLERKLN